MALYQTHFAFFNEPSDAAVGPVVFHGDHMTFEASQTACDASASYQWKLISASSLDLTPVGVDNCPRSDFMPPTGTMFNLVSRSVVPLG
jgi:hypothetical protein